MYLASRYCLYQIRHEVRELYCIYWCILQAATEYIVRVSFGTALIASIVFVYTTIIGLLSSRSEEDNRGRQGRSYDPGFTFYLSSTDLFWMMTSYLFFYGLMVNLK